MRLNVVLLAWHLQSSIMGRNWFTVESTFIHTQWMITGNHRLCRAWCILGKQAKGKVPPLMMREFKFRKSRRFITLWNKYQFSEEESLWVSSLMTIWFWNEENLVYSDVGTEVSSSWLLKYDSWSCNWLKYSQMPQSQKSNRQS